MPYLETPGELAEALADLVGVYGCHDEKCPGDEDLRHVCRMCWTGLVEDRIRQATWNEALLKATPRPDGEGGGE